MSERVQETMCECVRDGRFAFTRHAYDEMNNDDLFVFDLEQCIQTGTIAERQWDHDFNDWKYVVHGHGADGEEIAVVAKLDGNQKTIFITTFRL